MVRLTAVVYGYVQGVGFRQHTQRRARGLGLRGYVRNRGDGAVEVVAEGPRQAVEELYTWLQRGPAMADVSHVDAEWGAATGEWALFEVRY